jgi:hypothetical protein
MRVLLRDGAGGNGGAQRANRFQKVAPTSRLIHVSSPEKNT